MTRRIEITGLVFSLMLGIILIGAVPVGAQGYGGMYVDHENDPDVSGGAATGSGPTPTPTFAATPTPTPRPSGRLSLSISPQPAAVEPDGTLTLEVSMTAFGFVPGEYTIAALSLDERGGRLSPPRTSMSGSGTWQVRFHAGADPGTYPLLFVAQDRLGNHSAASTIVQVEIVVEPLLIAGNQHIQSTANSAALRIDHRSWWGHITSRKLVSSNWFEDLCKDIYQSHAWKRTISQATRIDRDRLNITGTLPQDQSNRSYTDIEPIMSRYWADGGITVSMMTLNTLGDLSKTWKAAPHLVVQNAPGIGHTLGIKTPNKGIQAGNILNGIGATMILLDFWYNMSEAKTPADVRVAWAKAEYGSLDLYLAHIIGKTFGSSVALPGMMVSYILQNSYDTLIGGYKTCWFKKMVTQALDANLLSESIHDTQAVNNVKAAMLSSKGLKGTLMEWWTAEAPHWAGKMGGCGNWDLAEAEGYQKVFVERMMRTTEVEIDGKKYHPWSFYYSVSRMLVLDRRREMARESAEGIREFESAYLSSLEQTTYLGPFRAVSSGNTQVPIKKAKVCPTEWHNNVVGCEDGWTTAEDGSFTAVIKGHLFSPKGTILMTIETKNGSHTFVVPQDEFEKVTP